MSALVRRKREKFMELHARYWPAWEGDCEVRLMYDDGAGTEF
jgi:hypothetical protein